VNNIRNAANELAMEFTSLKIKIMLFKGNTPLAEKYVLIIGILNKLTL
jgi:hypothetical protein